MNNQDTSGPAEAQDVNGGLLAAQRRATQAKDRVVGRKISAAQRRALEAEARLLSAAQKGVKWKILRFLAQPSVAAWTALFYVLISSIGVIYSWAFYLRFDDDIHIFQFFTTPDFLLSAFRDINTLVIGVGATLIGIGILVYRVYNSGIYDAYKFDRNRYRSEQRSRIMWEAALLLSVALLFIFLTFYLWWTSSYFQWPPISSVFSIIKEPHRTSLFIFALLVSLLTFALFPSFFIFFHNLIRRLFRRLLGEKRASQIKWEIWEIIFLLLITVLFILLIGIFLFSWDWREHSTISVVLLYLMSILILIPILFAFGRLFRNLLGEERESSIKWGGRFFALILLAEGIVILPFLSGVNDSKAALNDESRRPVKVTLRQGASEAGLLPPDRTLLLGTTSSFHIFYECENALKVGADSGAEGGPEAQAAQKQEDSHVDRLGVFGWWDALKQETDPKEETTPKCEKGRPFIIPTTNIASLAFGLKKDLPPHVVVAVDELDTIINTLKSETIEVTKVITRINTIITSINMSSGVHAKFITQLIERIKPEIVTRLSPDKIATVAIALKAYLEDTIPVTHLNATITTLNETIKTLNQADVPDPDLANIVGAIKSLNPLTVENSGLDNIPGAIKSLNPLAVKNPAQDGVIPAIGKNTEQISEAIKENTTKITDAIRGLNISCPGGPNPAQPPVQEHCPLGWEKVMTIWPFPKEEHELEQNSDGQKKLNHLFTEMEKKFGASTLGQLILVGRSDARPVCKQTLALYGSSNGLAQGRAKWIWDELVKKFTTSEQQKALHDRTLLLSAGPLHVRDEASEMNRAKDRAVEVYACWTPKEPEQASVPANPAQ